MPLRHEPDVSHAAWFTDRVEPWQALCCHGPSGYDGYVRLFHPLHEGAEADEHGLLDVEGDLDDRVLHELVTVLARHTSTPEDCFFALWDGWDLDGGTVLTSGGGLFRRRRAARPSGPAAFPATVMAGPRVRIPHRDYLLFRGPLDQVGQWGATERRPGCAHRINSPNLMWPADHAWFVATEVDAPWTSIGGSEALLRDLAVAGLDVERVAWGSDTPYWR